MKFSINQTELQNAISVVLKGVATRSTLPILSGILIDAKNDTLTLQTTDLELSIQYTVNALIEEPGKAVLPGKLCADIVKNLPNAAVHVNANEEIAIIMCDAASFSIKTLDPEDFPGFPHVDVTQKIAIPFPQFFSMVKKVARVVSRDDTRAILTGVLITLEEKKLKMVATDSYRLAIAETDLPDSMADEFEAVISGSFLQNITALPKSEEPVLIALAENQIVVTYQDTVFINRRIEGNFPNYRQLLPETYAARISMPIEHVIAAVKRTSLFGEAGSAVKFDININSQTTQLSSIAQDVGSAQETISCSGEGEDVQIAFNCDYLLDGLPVIGTNEVYLEVLSPLKPGIFRAKEPENFLYLIMPVRIA